VIAYSLMDFDSRDTRKWAMPSIANL
jgi:hypothetical protein